ncbi:hypothetical protein YC2023_021395 [Brassica napus]
MTKKPRLTVIFTLIKQHKTALISVAQRVIASKEVPIKVHYESFGKPRFPVSGIRKRVLGFSQRREHQHNGS